MAAKEQFSEIAGEAMLGGRLPELRERVQKDRILRMDQILEVQELGNPEVNSIIEQAIGYLGIALANVVNLINPGYVVADSACFNQKRTESNY